MAVLKSDDVGVGELRETFLVEVVGGDLILFEGVHLDEKIVFLRAGSQVCLEPTGLGRLKVGFRFINHFTTLGLTCIFDTYHGLIRLERGCVLYE